MDTKWTLLTIHVNIHCCDGNIQSILTVSDITNCSEEKDSSALCVFSVWYHLATALPPKHQDMWSICSMTSAWTSACSTAQKQLWGNLLIWGGGGTKLQLSAKTRLNSLEGNITIPGCGFNMLYFWTLTRTTKEVRKSTLCIPSKIIFTSYND